MLTEVQKQATLEALADDDGDIDADRVWKAAQSKDHPLHDYFPWNKNEAAIEHWRHIARKIIASCYVTVTYERVTYEVPKYVRNPDKPYNEQGYSLTARVAIEEDRARTALEFELARAESNIRRAANLARAFNLAVEFDAMVNGIVRLRRRVREKEPV